jgi:hypothetical protein
VSFQKSESSYKIEIDFNKVYPVTLDATLGIETCIKILSVRILDTHVEYLIKNDFNGAEAWITESQLRVYFKADLKAVTRGFNNAKNI